MAANQGGGPDMMKILPTLLPYMDPSTKRMLSIMIKIHELQELMEIKVEEEEVQKEEEMAEQAEETEEIKAGSPPPVTPAPQSGNLAAKLQEGLTPEQQSMITSLTGMLG